MPRITCITLNSQRKLVLQLVKLQDIANDKGKGKVVPVLN